MNISAAETRARILLIDDDELIAESLRSYLLEHDCDVDVATEPEAALALASLREYDTILVDPYLTARAGEDRLSLLAPLRAMQPRATVLVVTAYGTDAIADAVSGGMATALLLKPRAVAELGQAAMSRTSKPDPLSKTTGVVPVSTNRSPEKGFVE
jgi:DNA-binding response OmpR family regulator